MHSKERICLKIFSRPLWRGGIFFFCFIFNLTSVITPRNGPVHALEKNATKNNFQQLKGERKIFFPSRKLHSTR